MAIVRKLTTAALFAVVLGIAAVMLVPAVLGFERYVIRTGSMTGSIDAGSLTFNKPVPAADVRVGDVISFVPPAGHDVDGMITHRVHELIQGRGAVPVIRTKGDANKDVDTWSFIPRDGMVSRVEGHLPAIGRVYAELNTKQGRTIVFAIPGLIIAFSVLAGLWREAGADARRRREATLGNPESTTEVMA